MSFEVFVLSVSGLFFSFINCAKNYWIFQRFRLLRSFFPAALIIKSIFLVIKYLKKCSQAMIFYEETKESNWKSSAFIKSRTESDYFNFFLKCNTWEDAENFRIYFANADQIFKYMKLGLKWYCERFRTSVKLMSTLLQSWRSS